MTHWKRILFYSWAGSVILLEVCWMKSFERESWVGFASIRDHSIDVGATCGMLGILVEDHSADPFAPSGFYARFQRPDHYNFPDYPVGTLRFDPTTCGVTRIFVPIWVLILALTAFFALLYLLVHRRQRRHQARLPGNPASDH